MSSGGSPLGSSMPVTRPWNTVPGVGTTSEGETQVTEMPYSYTSIASPWVKRSRAAFWAP